VSIPWKNVEKLEFSGILFIPEKDQGMLHGISLEFKEFFEKEFSLFDNFALNNWQSPGWRNGTLCI